MAAHSDSIVEIIALLHFRYPEWVTSFLIDMRSFHLSGVLTCFQYFEPSLRHLLSCMEKQTEMYEANSITWMIAAEGLIFQLVHEVCEFLVSFWMRGNTNFRRSVCGVLSHVRQFIDFYVWLHNLIVIWKLLRNRWPWTVPKVIRQDDSEGIKTTANILDSKHVLPVLSSWVFRGISVSLFVI